MRVRLGRWKSSFFRGQRIVDVIGVSICDFELWPRREGSPVPMLSRWNMTTIGTVRTTIGTVRTMIGTV